MDRIKIFIYCSSVVLCGWLTASYTYQPSVARAAEAHTPSGTAGVPPAESSQPGAAATKEASREPLDTMATLENR